MVKTASENHLLPHDRLLPYFGRKLSVAQTRYERAGARIAVNIRRRIIARSGGEPRSVIVAVLIGYPGKSRAVIPNDHGRVTGIIKSIRQKQRTPATSADRTPRADRSSPSIHREQRSGRRRAHVDVADP